jgi:sirohydrochlorin ferrochelatase
MRRFLPLSLAIVALAGCSSAPPPPPFKPAADVKQLMASVVEPAADEYWDAVGWIVDEKGTMEIQPETPEEWDAVRNHAYVVAESGNLLMMSSRAKDGGEWMQLASSLVDAGMKGVRAAEAHNKQAVFDSGAEIYDVCTSCHSKYAVDLQRPNAAK